MSHIDSQCKMRAVIYLQWISKFEPCACKWHYVNLRLHKCDRESKLYAKHMCYMCIIYNRVLHIAEKCFCPWNPKDPGLDFKLISFFQLAIKYGWVRRECGFFISGPDPQWNPKKWDFIQVSFLSRELYLPGPDEPVVSAMLADVQNHQLLVFTCNSYNLN